MEKVKVLALQAGRAEIAGSWVYAPVFKLIVIYVRIIPLDAI